jgi:hypothetical protein
MPRKNEYDKILFDWARDWENENLSPEVQRLISQARYDLYYGPVADGAFGDPAEDNDEWDTYPGFVSACKQITKALADLPSELYIDIQCGDVSENEPQNEKCESCDGQGRVDTGENLFEDNEEGDDVECENCRGIGCFEPAGEWFLVERKDIRKAILGSELAEYV